MDIGSLYNHLVSQDVKHVSYWNRVDMLAGLISWFGRLLHVPESGLRTVRVVIRVSRGVTVEQSRQTILENVCQAVGINLLTRPAIHMNSIIPFCLFISKPCFKLQSCATSD